MKLIITPLALVDLAEIHAYIKARDGHARADRALAELDAAIQGLVPLARRGHVPPELADEGETDVLEIHHKPWRIVFECSPAAVNVLIVADGRRNFEALLTRRILRGR